jgi:hypothetical protein
MTYDQRCADLAQTFLVNENLATEENVDTLAGLIQQTIEDTIETMRAGKMAEHAHYRVEWKAASGEWQRLSKRYDLLGEAEYAARKDAGSPTRIIKVMEIEEVLACLQRGLI